MCIQYAVFLVDWAYRYTRIEHYTFWSTSFNSFSLHSKWVTFCSAVAISPSSLWEQFPQWKTFSCKVSLSRTVFYLWSRCSSDIRILICKKLLLIFAVIYLVDTDGNISRRHMFIPGFALYCSLLVQFLNKKMRCVSLNLTSCLFFVSDKTSCNDWQWNSPGALFSLVPKLSLAAPCIWRKFT